MKEDVKKLLLQAQRAEITEHYIYMSLANSVKGEYNKEILKHIAGDELRHYNIWKDHTKQDIRPSKYVYWKYILISRIFGLTFGLKLMEKGEELAQENYMRISKHIKGDATRIQKDEHEHEKKILSLLDEERLRYVSSIVLGLNDALVELTGALAGLTLALQNSRIIAMVGLITGIAASLSMGASEYLSTKSEAREKKSGEGEKSPFKASIYTTIAYILTVLFLISPYLVIDNLYGSLVWMMINAIVVIFLFTYYVSVAKDVDFKKEFWSMAIISLSVAIISFGIGYAIRILFGVEV